MIDKFHSKSSEAVFSTVFFHYNLRPEVGSDVIFGVAVDYARVDVRVKLGDSTSNGCRYIRRSDLVSNEHDEAYPNSSTYWLSP